MSAITVCPKWDQRQFSTIVSNKVSLCCNIALGTVGIQCQICWEKLDNTLDYFVKLLMHSNSSVPDHRILFSKLCLYDIIKLLLYTNDLSYQPKNNIQSTSVMWACCTCHLMKFSLTWSVNSCASHHALRMWLWKFSMSGWHSLSLCLRLSLSLSLSLSLAGVNGASFCLVQHPCYFDVLAIPLPDQ